MPRRHVQPAVGKALGDKPGQALLNGNRRSCAYAGDVGSIDIDTPHSVPEMSETRGNRQPDMAEPYNGDPLRHFATLPGRSGSAMDASAGLGLFDCPTGRLQLRSQCVRGGPVLAGAGCVHPAHHVLRC